MKKTMKNKNEQKKKITNKITKDMTIGEVVSKYPGTIAVFMQQGLHCIGCGIAQFESIEQGAAAHGIDVKKLIAELNKVAKKT